MGRCRDREETPDIVLLAATIFVECWSCYFLLGLLGLDGAKARAAALVDEACEALAGYGAAADPLRAAARFVISRQS